MTFCLAAGLALQNLRRLNSRQGRFTFATACAAVAVCALALWLTHSRGAMAATVVALAALLTAQAVAHKWRLKHLVLVGGGFILVLIIALCAPGLAKRLPALGSDALLRNYIFEATVRAANEAPWLGHGLGSFEVVMRAHLTAETYELFWNIRSAENVYAQWLLEAGWLGALSMFASIGAIIAVAVVQVARRRTSLGLLHALLAADVVFILHGVTDFALQTYSMAAMWAFLLGLQLSWSLDRQSLESVR